MSNSTEWILDTGATGHFCSNKDLMHDFEDAPDGEHVYMGNADTVGVMGKGKVLLTFTSEESLSITTRKTQLLELVHSDLADFKNTISKGEKKWYITFVDDFSKYTRVYLLKSKDEVEESFLKYKAEVENQLDRKIKRLRSDRGGEYDTNSLTAFYEKNGIIHETSAPYTPPQNGLADGKNVLLKK